MHDSVAPKVGGAHGGRRRRRRRQQAAAHGPGRGEQGAQDGGSGQQPAPVPGEGARVQDQPASGGQSAEDGRSEQGRHGGGEDDVVLDAVHDAAMGQVPAPPGPQVEIGLPGVVDEVARVEPPHQHRRQQSGDRPPEAPEDEDLRKGRHQVHHREDHVEPGGCRHRFDHLQPPDLDHLVDHPAGDTGREESTHEASRHPRPPVQAARQAAADGWNALHRGAQLPGDFRGMMWRIGTRRYPPVAERSRPNHAVRARTLPSPESDGTAPSPEPRRVRTIRSSERGSYPLATRVVSS